MVFSVCSRRRNARNELGWSLLAIYYAAKFWLRALVAIVTNFSEIWKHGSRGLRNLRFRDTHSSWDFLVDGEYVQAKNGLWYPCFKTFSYAYCSFSYPAVSSDTPMDNDVDKGAIERFEKCAASCLGAGVEDAGLFISGFEANVQTIKALGLMNEGATVFIWDEKSHRSSFEGLRHLANKPFRHNDCEDLERVLQDVIQTSSKGSSIMSCVWVLVEEYYSMSGNIPPAKGLYELKQRYGFNVLLDQAHSVNVVGEGEYGDENIIAIADLRTLSFSKFAGLFGGLVVGNHDCVQWIRCQASPESRSYPSSCLQYMHLALGYIEDGTMALRAQVVRDLSTYAWDLLTSHGWRTTSPRGSHILILPIGYSDLAAAFQQWCFRRGIACAIVGHPAVPEKFKLAFRLCINASMTKEDLDEVVRVLDSYSWSVCKAEIPELPASVAPPTRTAVALGVGAVRNLGGTTHGVALAEQAIAKRFGYDHCKYTSEVAISTKEWVKNFRRYSGVDCAMAGSVTEIAGHRAQNAPVVLCPVKPFGLIMLCMENVWKPEFILLNPVFVFSSSVSPCVWSNLLCDSSAEDQDSNLPPLALPHLLGRPMDSLGKPTICEAV
jgi:7-keto-8-aminopelargonate synthetase-like enzyme